MYTALISLLLFAAGVLRPISIVEPGYPPNAVNGGTVVAELVLVPGNPTDVRILSGDGAFAEAALTALQGWAFVPKENTSLIVVVHFRDPNFYSTGNPVRRVPPPPPDLGLAYPRDVIDPAYPVNSLGQGSVVIRADIGATGAVTDTEVVKPEGDLTQPSLQAVRNWHFLPARDARGRAVPSNVYTVLVYRMPVNAPRPPGR